MHVDNWFQRNLTVFNFLQTTIPDDSKFKRAMLCPEHGKALIRLSTRLSYMDRREEALEAVQEAAELYRQLAKDDPTAFNPDLAISLDILSNHLSNLGHREDALDAIREAVELHRRLAKD